MKFVQLKDESDQAVVSPMSRMHPPYDAPVYVEESFPAWFDGGPINLQVASIPGVFGNTADGLDRDHGNPRSLIVGCLVVSASVRRSNQPCRPAPGKLPDSNPCLADLGLRTCPSLLRWVLRRWIIAIRSARRPMAWCGSYVIAP